MRNAGRAIVFIVLALLLIGLFALFSASSYKGMSEYKDPLYFLVRQVQWLGVGAILCLAATVFDYHWLHRPWVNFLLIAGTVALLGAVLVPGLGVDINGSRRWLRVAGMGLQPTEFAKVTVIVFLANWMSLKGRYADTFKHGLLFPSLFLGAVLFLIYKEPDFGSMFLIGVIGAGIMFLGGSRTSHVVGAGLLGALGGIALVLHNPNRLMRLMAFLFRKEYPEAAHQVIQSETALSLGGIWGSGYTRSLQKFDFLPEAHNDFIFAILGEEWGLLATVGVTVLFLLLLVFGLSIARRAPDRFGFLLAFGMTMLLALEGFINIGVVSGCLPTKGLALPFISYGGSSLVCSLTAVGILLNVARHVAAADDHVRPIKNRDLRKMDMETYGPRYQQT